MELTLELLERRLRQHDWYYMMSDDYNVYIRGREDAATLWQQAVSLGQEGKDLYKRIQAEMTEN